jgi:CMP-N,N'-diacetyllegionaminic acid synthase
MNNNIIIHALIPARGGSKSIPHKNIKIYKKYPLLVHSINIAKDIKLISKIVVSTDCYEIKKIALKNGADVPFIRPSNISGDFSTDIECFKHYISWLQDNKQQIPDIIVHLRPTYPERNNNIVYKCLTKFIEVCNIYTSLRTVVPIDKSLFKMYTINSNDTTLKPTYDLFNNIKEPFNQVRQILPTTYLHNGCVDIINTKTLKNGSMSGDKIYPYVMENNETYDIDTNDDWKRSLTENINSESKEVEEV